MQFDVHFYAVAAIAVILLGLSKGGLAGLGTAATPLLATMVPPVMAAGIILPVLVVQDVFTVYAYRHSWDRKNLIRLMPGSLLGVTAGYLLASRVSDAAIMLVIGVVTVLFTLFQTFHRATRETGTGAGVVMGLLCGATSGFTSMIANAGSPPFQMYVLPQRLPPTMFVGTSAIFFGATNWIKLIPFTLLGQFNTETLTISATLMPLAIASTYAGVWVIRRMSSAKFYPLISGLLFCVGLRLLWAGAKGVGIF